jgi:hypothetical protein
MLGEADSGIVKMESPMGQPVRVELAVHAGEPPEHYNIGNLLDLGGLLGALVVPTEELGGTEPGSVKVEAVRTHEWELLVVVVSVGAEPLITGLMQELGKRLAGWLVREAQRIGGRHGGPPPGPPEMRGSGGHRVVVDSDDPSVAQAAARLLEAAANQSLRVELVVEPRR